MPEIRGDVGERDFLRILTSSIFNIRKGVIESIIFIKLSQVGEEVERK